MIFEKKSRIAHSDEDLGVDPGLRAKSDLIAARYNIGQLDPSGSADELAERMVSVVDAERTRRNGHYHRYRALFTLARGDRLFTSEEENIAEASLLDMNQRINSLDSLERVSFMKGKGISAELSHVDQLGSWAAGNDLDNMIRSLPVSPRLDNAGFFFADTFGEPSTAKLSYNFHLVGTSKGTSLMGVRKRAAADVLSPDGHVIELVKRSSFLIDVGKLEQPQLQNLGRVMPELMMKPDERPEDYKQHVDDTGYAIIEPYITNKELRYSTNSILAATSLYFALYRFPEES